MAISEQQLRDILQTRNFFAAAQASYRRLMVFEEGELEKLRQKKRLSKADRELFAVLDDPPPYRLVAEKVLPSLLYWAERWEQMTDPDVWAARPLLRYVYMGCDDPDHEEKHGLLYPQEHPFWREWMPPNSFPCSCSVDSVSLDLLARQRKEQGDWQWKDGPALESFEFRHPDAGFDFNVGMLMPKAVSTIQPAPQALESPAATIKKPQGFFSRLFSWEKISKGD